MWHLPARTRRMTVDKMCQSYLQCGHFGLFRSVCWLWRWNQLLVHLWQLEKSVAQIETHWCDLETQLGKENVPNDSSHRLACMKNIIEIHYLYFDHFYSCSASHIQRCNTLDKVHHELLEQLKAKTNICSGTNAYFVCVRLTAAEAAGLHAVPWPWLSRTVWI